MSSTTAVSLPYEIRERADVEGGLWLELVVEGEVTGTARASADALESMRLQLGLDRHGVAGELSTALEKLLRNQLEKVTLSEPVEDPTRPLRFRASYAYRDHRNVEAGLVWYDVSSSETGPEELSAIVRNKMRLEVHRKLTGSGGAARALVELHE